MNSSSQRPMLAAAASLLACLAGIASGCAAVKATQQPDKHDMSVLNRGVPRTHVIAELGAPTWSDERDGVAVDVFRFKQGYTKMTKAARALVHGAADVATFGLWEVVGIPAEALADGTDVQLEVHYDPTGAVDRVVVIQGENAVHPPKLFARKTRLARTPTSDPPAAAPTTAAVDELSDAAFAEDDPVAR